MSALSAFTLPAWDLRPLQEVNELAASTDLPFDLVRLEVLDRLRRWLRAERAVFFLAGTDTLLADPVSVHVDALWLHRFQAHFIGLDPFVKTISPSATITRREDLLDEGRFFRSPFYNDFWRPQGIHHKLGICLSSGDRFLGAIGLMRRRQDPAFGEREVQLARLVAPTLTLALERHRLLSRLGEAKPDAVGTRLRQRYALSAREAEVARAVIEGRTNLEISRVLGISEFTVKKHLQNIFEKMGVRSRSALTSRALGGQPPEPPAAGLTAGRPGLGLGHAG